MELILVITFVALAALAFYYTRKKPASTVATPSTVEEAPAPVVEEAPVPATVVEEAPVAKKPRKPRAPKAAPAPVVAEKPVKATRKPRAAKAEPAPAPAKKPRAPRSKKV